MKEYSPLVFDNGLNEIVSNANALWLVKDPVANDAINNNYAALDAKRVASVTLAGGDKVLADYASGRQVTTAAKTDSAADADSVGGDDLHFALVDTVNSRVLAITDETTDQAITSGNGVNLPSLGWKIAQPA